jgi:hypothetical protein
MTSTIAEREKAAPSVLNGNGSAQSGLQTASSLYRQIAALASALGRIERELKDSLGWLHDGLCDCPQCLSELARQRKLLQARARLLMDLCALTGKAH